ncbi:threonine/serine ThrE exporter family protein [Timonella sp. A28]|uniref:threonine/serine ThrE exporter family protein n=1 Tax=Timonella sp. A28 TaxID=3442640 RepID=UPI003EC04ACF
MYTRESQFEPVELIRASRLVVRVGRVLLTAGSGSYRVKSAMRSVGAALGMTSIHAQVTINEITATCHRGSIYRTEVAQTATIGVNSDRIRDIQNYCDNLPPADSEISGEDLAVRLNEVEAFLDEIEAKPHLYRDIANSFFAAVACAAFAFLNNGGLIEIGAVFLGAGLGQYTRRLMLHRGLNQLAVTMLAAAVASTVYLGITNGMYLAGWVDSIHESGYISSVLFLVPGFPLITAALDLSRLDFSAGLSRLAYALMIMISAALSVWAVSAVFGLNPVPPEPLPLSAEALFGFRLLASALGVWGFAMIFNSPWNVALIAALIGMVANTARLVMIDEGIFAQGAAFFAGLIVGILTNLLAPRLNIPRITVSVPAVVIMIPGAAGYRTIYYFNSGDTLQALTYGVEAIFVVIAVAIGLTFARSLTDRHWFDTVK